MGSVVCILVRDWFGERLVDVGRVSMNGSEQKSLCAAE